MPRALLFLSLLAAPVAAVCATEPADPLPEALAAPAPSPDAPVAPPPELLSAAADAEHSAPPPAAAKPDPVAEERLQEIVRRQQVLFAKASGDDPKIDEEDFRTQFQQLSFDYESLLKEHPTAKGFAAFGYFLGKVDMRRQSIAMLLKSNQLDPDQPFVKNQIGNYLAEEGQPLEAVNYFLAAIKLAPNEPLYHYQLGTLLHEARDDFLKSGHWSRADLDRTMHDAFRHAAELAPDRIEFTYRYAESFYDLEQPDWDGALKAWSALEEKAQSNVERETMRLHAANIFIKRGEPDKARVLLATVHEPALDGQKEKLVAQLTPAPQK